MVDYLRSKATADRLIDKFGQSAILSRAVATGPVYAPVAGTPATSTVKIVVLSYSAYEVGQGRVRMTDRKVLMARGNLSVDPAPGDTVEIGGLQHVIIGPDEGNGVKPFAPGGIIIMYELQCRR